MEKKELDLIIFIMSSGCNIRDDNLRDAVLSLSSKIDQPTPTTKTSPINMSKTIQQFFFDFFIIIADISQLV